MLALQMCNLRKQWGSHLTLGCRGEDDCILLATAVPAATVLAAAASCKDRSAGSWPARGAAETAGGEAGSGGALGRAAGLNVGMAMVRLIAADFWLVGGVATEADGAGTFWAARSISAACGGPAGRCAGSERSCWPAGGVAAGVTDGGTLGEALLRPAAGDAAVGLGILCNTDFCLVGGTAAGGGGGNDLGVAVLFGAADGLGGDCNCRAGCGDARLSVTGRADAGLIGTISELAGCGGAWTCLAKLPAPAGGDEPAQKPLMCQCPSHWQGQGLA